MTYHNSECDSQGAKFYNYQADEGSISSITTLAPTGVLQQSYALAIVVDVVLFVVLMRVGKRSVKLPDGASKTFLRGVICDDDLHPSLARFQLLVWTFVIVFAFLVVSFVRILSGVPPPTTLPPYILTLLGINAGSTVISYGQSGGKYYPNLTVAPQEPPQPLSTMLEENSQFSVTRFQMLSWTLVAVLIFLGAFFTTMANLPSPLTQLDIPDVSSTLVALTGISQGAYLTGKQASH
jgi:hypothetical protein